MARVRLTDLIRNLLRNLLGVLSLVSDYFYKRTSKRSRKDKHLLLFTMKRKNESLLSIGAYPSIEYYK